MQTAFTPHHAHKRNVVRRPCTPRAIDAYILLIASPARENVIDSQTRVVHSVSDGHVWRARHGMKKSRRRTVNEIEVLPAGMARSCIGKQVAIQRAVSYLKADLMAVAALPRIYRPHSAVLPDGIVSEHSLENGCVCHANRDVIARKPVPGIAVSYRCTGRYSKISIRYVAFNEAARGRDVEQSTHPSPVRPVALR
jgi:hypothetical protein